MITKSYTFFYRSGILRYDRNCYNSFKWIRNLYEELGFKLGPLPYASITKTLYFLLPILLNKQTFKEESHFDFYVTNHHNISSEEECWESWYFLFRFLILIHMYKQFQILYKMGLTAYLSISLSCSFLSPGSHLSLPTYTWTTWTFVSNHQNLSMWVSH